MKSIAAFLAASLIAAAVPVAARATGSEALIATVEHYLRVQTQGLPGKVETEIGRPDPRLNLADCAQQEAFLPPGNRLWGKTTVGVRCLDAAAWTIYLPVRISIRGSYLVTARAIAAGQTLLDSDVAVRQGDLTTLPASVLTNSGQAVGKTLKNGLAAGLPLRADQLLATPVIQQGQDVRLIYKGNGFAVSNEGKALNTAAEGQVARARTASGQTVSGVARSGGIIEIAP